MYKLTGTLLVIGTVALATILTGCTATNTLASGVSEKDISSSGTIAISKVGLNTTTQTPEALSVLVFGDYSSHNGDGEQFRAEYSEDVSIFNTNAKSKTYKMVFFSSNSERIDAFIEASNDTIKDISQDELEVIEEDADSIEAIDITD